MFRISRQAARVAIAAGVLGAAACTGGGGSPVAPPPPPPPPPVNTGPVYTPGVFAAASLFKDRCEIPRTGVDIEGNPFPDQAGSTAIENFWLRSWTNETYLWNDEVTDQDPYEFDDRIEYFNLMRTFAVEPSGEDRDDFHFSQSTEDFLEQRNSAPSASYGVSYAALRSSPPRDFRIRYTDPGTPASTIVNGRANFVRGDRILEVDGVDFVNGGDIDAINAALFPATAGEVHNFRMQAPNGDIFNVTLTAADLSSDPVNRVNIIDTPSGKVGYVLFNTFSPFSSEEEIVDAITQLDTEGVTDLVLDLRYNGGGLLAVAAQLGYMVAGNTATAGRTFENLRFNASSAGRNPVTGSTNNAIPFLSDGQGFSVTAGQPLPSLDLTTVYILSTERTCSASEAVINGLRGIDINVVLIGDTTCGKPYGFYPTDNCGITYYTIQFQGVNDKGFGDFADGFIPNNSLEAFGVRVPGCQVTDNLNSVLGDENEPLLAAALQFRATGTCPTPVTTTFSVNTLAAPEDPALAISTPINVFENNRDMRLPEGNL